MRYTFLLVLSALVLTACARSPRARQRDLFDNEIGVPAAQQTELREGRWLLALGKVVVTGVAGDEVQTAAVWIDYTPGK